MSAFNNEKLKEMRKRAGYTQAEFAKMVGVARTTYAEYEQGKIQPPLDKIDRMCRLFRLSTSQLVNIENKTGVDISKVRFRNKMSDEDKILRITELQRKEHIKKTFDEIFKKVSDLDCEERQMLLPILSYLCQKYEFTAIEEEMVQRVKKGMVEW